MKEDREEDRELLLLLLMLLLFWPPSTSIIGELHHPTLSIPLSPVLTPSHASLRMSAVMAVHERRSPTLTSTHKHTHTSNAGCEVLIKGG